MAKSDEDLEPDEEWLEGDEPEAQIEDEELEDEALEDEELDDVFEEDDADADEDDEDDDDADETDEEALDELEAEELDMLTDDEESETLIVDEAEELRAIRRAELSLQSGAASSEKSEDEFVCQSCFLVLKSSQLANKRKMYCRDCAA